ncbi:hypothetical protein TIFTF001_026718 [Ficus carica]|uniref:Uncharacterized protein n=1 Tax=Ficus carica TaxID=3494 RepID=A0AA88DLR4_FICCA|nr:hypothetical protein TIFTF001_026718 [Ficus carica]
MWMVIKLHGGGAGFVGFQEEAHGNGGHGEACGDQGL